MILQSNEPITQIAASSTVLSAPRVFSTGRLIRAHVWRRHDRVSFTLCRRSYLFLVSHLSPVLLPHQRIGTIAMTYQARYGRLSRRSGRVPRKNSKSTKSSWHFSTLTLASVVFSSWTSSLDMVERALRCDPNQVIPFVRIDGKVTSENRGIAIERLRDDPGIRVILITIACGSCG